MSLQGEQDELRIDRDRSPVDLVEDAAQTGALGGIHHGDEVDAAEQVGPEQRMVFAILTVRPLANAVGEDGLEMNEVRTGDVEVLVDDEACRGSEAGNALRRVASFLTLPRGNPEVMRAKESSTRHRLGASH
jgi:hypothetical protein